MKYIKYLSFLLILLFPINAKANISLDCPSSGLPNTRIYCHIKSSAKVSSFEGRLFLDPKVAYFGITEGTDFNNETSYFNLIFTAKDSSVGGTAIAAFQIHIPQQLKAGDAFDVSLTGIKYKYINNNDLRLQNNLNSNIKIVAATTIPKTTSPSTSKTFNVVLDSNNGSNDKRTLSCSTTGSNCNIDLSTIVKPIKTASEFTGWGNTPSCTTGSLSSYRADSNTTLYACWKTNQTTPPIENNDNLYLKTLNIDGQVVEFSKFKFDYDLTVLYEIDSLDIQAEADEDVEVEVSGADELVVGDNTITIKLTANDDKTSNYIINVKRLNEGEVIKELSGDASLKSISLGKYEIEFSPTVVNYTVYIDSKTTSIPVVAQANEENASVLVEGNTNLKSGSLIKIIVTAEDGTTNTYNIDILVKESIIEQYKLYIIAGLGLILLLIILISINKAKKKDQKKKVKKPKVVKTKVPKTAPKSVSKPSSEPKSVPVDPKSQVEVLDI